MLVPIVSALTRGQDGNTGTPNELPLTLPDRALDILQEGNGERDPLLIAQGEIDAIIRPDGGGACPISAGLIAVQAMRSMAGLPLDQHPHRTALRVFQELPELKEGRISNHRFVALLKLLCKDLRDIPVAISVESAPTSTYDNTSSRWSPAEGPDLSVRAGQIKVLAFTVADENRNIVGRHFVLLQRSDGTQISFVDPRKPEQDHTFRLEYRGDVAGLRNQLFFTIPSEISSTQNTFELNTVFTVRTIVDNNESALPANASVDQTKAKIDELAATLRARDDLVNPIAWRSHGASFGLPGLDLPADVGGSNKKAVEMLELFRHAGRHNLNLRDVIGAAHGRPLAQAESPYAKKVLSDIIAGKAYVAIAITEPEAGSDMRGIQSRATKDGVDFLLNGHKLWNARLRQATHVVLYTLAASGAPGSRTAFLLPIDHPGLNIIDEAAHGLTGNSYGGLVFTHMRVGPENVLGADGDGGEIFTDHFIYWRLMQAAAAIGCGEAALDQMAARIKVRQAYGGPIGRFTHLQQPLGEHTTKLRMAVALAREAAQLIDNGEYEAASPLVNGIKAEAVEVALAAADVAMRSHGALGYSHKVDLGDRVRDLMGLRIADGTTDVMRMEVVRSTYGSELWKMAIRSYSTDEPEAAVPEEAIPAASAVTQ